MTPRPGTLSDQAVNACRCKEGRTLPELNQALPCSLAVVNTTIPQLVRAGCLFKAGVRLHYRYFATAEDAKAWEEKHAAEIAEILAFRNLDPEEKQRIKDRRKNERRKAERHAEMALRPPKPIKEAKPLREAKLAVQPKAARQPAPKAEKPAKLPEQAKVQKPSRDRSSQAYTVVTAVDKAKTPWAPKKKAEAKPIYPPGYKHTYCPSYEDTRFKPDPGIAGRGAITQDWRDRRLQEQRR